MSIGFSVDFTAHICYHHWFSERNERLLGLQLEKSDHQRLVNSLSSVGRPMIEAALSTIICLAPLFFVDIYVVISFVSPNFVIIT
jgi:predicted RND superfamily exporter protein